MRRALEGTLTAETPYQAVMVGALLELLLLGALLPRVPGVAPVVFEVVAGVRLATLLALAALLATQSQPPRAVAAFGALALWGALLLPPELWAFALEARAGFPITALSSILLAAGFYAGLRVHLALGWLYALLVGAGIGAQGWQLEPPMPGLIAVLTLGVALIVWRALIEARVERTIPT